MSQKPVVAKPVVAVQNAAFKTQNFSSPVAKNRVVSDQPEVLPAGLWLRAVLGFDAPFGFDGLPTVWG